MKAAERGHLGVAGLLMRLEPAMQTEDGWTALMGAVSNGHAGIAKLLIPLEKGRKSNGDNALHLACSHSQKSCAELLWAAPEERNGLDEQQLQGVKSKFGFE